MPQRHSKEVINQVKKSAEGWSLKKIAANYKLHYSTVQFMVNLKLAAILLSDHPSADFLT